MRRDSLLLRIGYVASVVLAVAAFALKLGLMIVIGVLVGVTLLTRIGLYAYYERYLAFKCFSDFTSGRIRHECIACGSSCHLKVNLAKDDVERILKHAKEVGLKDTVIEKHRNRYWLRRTGSGACVFLSYKDDLPRCSIYAIRPTACRLYPLIPVGSRLKVDPLCPGLSKESGHTFNEHLRTQEVGPYVRKVLGKIRPEQTEQRVR